MLKSRILLPLLILLPLCFISFAGSNHMVGDIRFTVLPTEEGNTSRGYLDSRALVENTGNEKRSVTITSGQSRYLTVKRTITLAPKAKARLSLPCPPANGSSQIFSVRVHESGKYKDNIYAGSGSSNHSLYSNGYAFIVLDPLDPDKFISGLKPKPGSAPGSHRSSSGSSIWNQATSKKWSHGIDQLSRIWQGLARFDGIVMTRTILEGASAQTKQTLSEYILSGGNLIVFDATSNPLSFHSETTPQKKDGISIQACGFGHLILLADSAIDSFTTEHCDAVRDHIQSRKITSSRPQPLEIHRKLPVIDNVTIPLRSTFLLMLVFSIVAGPILIIVLGRKNKRILLNWAIPVLAIATSAVLVIYALISEGITPNVILSGITHLNQIDHMAVTIGTQGYYTPFIPAEGLQFGTTSEIIKYTNRRFMHRDGAKQIEWTHGQNFGRGWISARIPEYFSCRTVERRRERINFTKGDVENTLSIVNGLGTDIEKLIVVDHQGITYKATDIKNGASVELTAEPGKARPSGIALPELLEENIWKAELNGKGKPGFIQLSPGTYQANLSAAPFIENGLNYKSCKIKATSIIHGVWELSDGR